MSRDIFQGDLLVIFMFVCDELAVNVHQIGRKHVGSILDAHSKLCSETSRASMLSPQLDYRAPPSRPYTRLRIPSIAY